jgi:regulator of replication initiation timing
VGEHPSLGWLAAESFF